MTKDTTDVENRASWQWFAVPAVLIAAVGLVVVATTIYNDDQPGDQSPARVEAGDAEPRSEPPPAPDPLTGTAEDIEDGLVRAGVVGSPQLLVQPTRLDAAGFNEFVVTGQGWASAPPIFILACGPEVVLLDMADPPASCNLDDLTPVTPQDGEFETVLVYDAPSGGFTIVASDPTGSEWAVEFVQVR